ncbi:hypothetical protein G7Y89_g7355 [Cudoniella acicularis]|uniref:Uncharacterized protein n=1 Tax=Cudoniella acicularis TaxID=354080 RepID=A0A8H4RIN1_9HELO|nr:hypothetical protein G7Y89_g7355 [Cudoniella acicularis]
MKEVLRGLELYIRGHGNRPWEKRLLTKRKRKNEQLATLVKPSPLPSTYGIRSRPHSQLSVSEKQRHRLQVAAHRITSHPIAATSLSHHPSITHTDQKRSHSLNERSTYALSDRVVFTAEVYLDVASVRLTILLAPSLAG